MLIHYLEVMKNGKYYKYFKNERGRISELNLLSLKNNNNNNKLITNNKLNSENELIFRSIELNK